MDKHATLGGASFTDPAGSSSTVTITGITGQLTDNTAVGATAVDGITNQWTDGSTANATSNPDDAETITDVAAPQVSDLAIYDTDFNGLIDKIIVTFSENVDTDDGSAPVAGDFGTIVLPDGQNATLGGAFTDPAGSSSTVTITGITGQLTDNTAVGATAVDGITNQWKDGAANATSNPDEFETITDAAAPQVSDLAIYDTDFNGLIDKIIVTFSENVDTDDGSAPVAGDFGTIVLPDGQTRNFGRRKFHRSGWFIKYGNDHGDYRSAHRQHSCRSYCCRWDYQSVDGWRCYCELLIPMMLRRSPMWQHPRFRT